MNSFEFYSKLQQYKDKSTLSHASIPASYKNLATGLNNMKNYGYYNKIDNFYGPGKSRYFYSKDEWDAYQREKDAMYQKAKDEVKKKKLLSLLLLLLLGIGIGYALLKSDLQIVGIYKIKKLD